MVEPLTKIHVDAVARLHSSSLTGLLRDLGPRAIRAFYIGAIKSDCAIAFVVFEQEILRGFVFGATTPQLLKQDILKNNFVGTIVGTALGVLRRPSALISLWRSTRGTGERGYNDQVAELTYLAVDSKHRTAGLGQQLVNRFGQALVERGIYAYELSVDANNASAIKFYHQMGFFKIGEYQEFGTNHLRYRLDLS
jgi:ribosomal protein S18 acetylase RimI-like enzyme